MRPTPKQTLFLVALAVIGVAFLVTQLMTRGAPGSIERRGDVITRIMTSAETDAVAEYPIRLLEGGDAAHEATHIFEVIDGIQGIGAARLDVERVVLMVEYDAATVTPEIIRNALISSGYVEITSADAAPTEVAPDGSSQRIAIADERGFRPAYIRAKAGIPIVLDFAPGTECRLTIYFPQLDIHEDISRGASVTLPALEPGFYDIFCGQGGSEGGIFVE
ncbi:MAG: cupredoxin domain-containing protein [Aeromicrobium sp.]|jgi:hypothetical protein|nr:cupredoxin domain-containing protein [Aeromicrobium sp.]